MAERTLPSTDGRLQRSERSRAAIVNAVLELVHEGVLLPTAQQVAERAGVGIRSVFRHYSDMETLFNAMSDHWRAEATNHLAQPALDESMAERAVALVRRRAELYERFAPIHRSKLLLVWKSESMRRDQELGYAALRKERRRWLPEFDKVPPAIAEAFDSATSFSSWNQLFEAQNLDHPLAIAALEVHAVALVRTAQAHIETKGRTDDDEAPGTNPQSS